MCILSFIVIRVVDVRPESALSLEMKPCSFNCSWNFIGTSSERKTQLPLRERNVLFNDALNTFIYGCMASDIWLRTILIVRKETRCRHIDYSYRLTARVLLYAPSHRQDNTYHGLFYTSRGALAGTRNSSMGPPHEGSIRRPIAPWPNALPLSYVPLQLDDHRTLKAPSFDRTHIYNLRSVFVNNPSHMTTGMLFISKLN